MGRKARDTDAWSRTVAAQLSDERTASGLTHQQAWERAGLSRSTYWSVISGRIVCDVVQLAALARVFGVAASVLVRRAEQRPPEP